MRSLLILAAAMAAALPALAASPVADALQRPALRIKAPQRAVLLAADWAGERMVAVGERGVISLSDDGGASWRQAPCPVSVTLTMVRFANAKQGVAVGHGGVVLTTDDAGSSWVLRLDGRRLAVLAKEAAQSPEAVAEAARLASDGPDKPFLDVLLWDARRMLAVGAYGLAFYTSDGGQTWTPWMKRLPNPKALHWYVARRAGNAILLAGEQGLLARSEDDGATFAAVASPYKGSWFAGDLAADGQAVLAGLRGNVWRSTDGATRWTQVASPVASGMTAMARATDGQLLLASQAGVVLRLQGDTLVPWNTAPVPMPAALLPQRNGGLVTLGVAGAVPAMPKDARP